MVKVAGSLTYVRDTFQITKEQQNKLKELAKNSGRSKAEFVREALDLYFNQLNK